MSGKQKQWERKSVCESTVPKAVNEWEYILKRVYHSERDQGGN